MRRLTQRETPPILRAMLFAPAAARCPRPPFRALPLLALVLCLGAGSAAAAADQPADTLMQLLSERGLVKPDTNEPGLVQQVRDHASEMVLTAMNFLGVPYRRGGNSEVTGFDCSGFTRHIFEMTLGLVLPRRVDEQASAAGLLAVERNQLRPGDLVFFNTLRRTFSHVGIYIGEGRFIHSPRPGGEVRVENMGFSYWNLHFTGARRVESAAPPAVVAEPALTSLQ